MKILLIINPNAGPNSFRKQVDRARQYLADQGCQVRCAQTTHRGHATDLARRAVEDGFDTVVAVGGDGTINEVCNGLAGSNTALAVLPAGTANVYAAEMGIPIWHPLNSEAVIKGAEVIAKGWSRQIDLGHLRLATGTSRYFLMWCGIGLDAAITEKKGSPTKSRPLNFAAWIVSGLLITYDFMGTPATLTTDNEEIHERVIMAVVSNAQLYGRIWRLAPRAKMDDGLLDVGVLTGHRWPSTAKHILGLTLHRHIEDPSFHLYRTTKLSLTARYELPVHVDAETIGLTPVEIETAPRALRVIIPHNAPARLFEENGSSVAAGVE